MNCINCGKEANEKFCAHCGHPTRIKRITFKDVWADFWMSAFGFDGMLARTLKDLTIRPGHAARQYINGNRKKYYGPVGYFLLMITLFLLLMSLLDMNLLDFINGKRGMFVVPAIQAQEDAKLTQLVLQFISQNMKIFVFLIVPFHAFAARYLLFRKSGLNFMENLVLPFYLMGHLYWLNIISVILFKFTNSYFFNAIVMVMALLYYGYAYSGLISYQPRWKSFLKGIGVYLGGQLTLIVVASLVIGIVIATMAFINPEALKMIKPAKNL